MSKATFITEIATIRTAVDTLVAAFPVTKTEIDAAGDDSSCNQKVTGSIGSEGADDSVAPAPTLSGVKVRNSPSSGFRMRGCPVRWRYRSSYPFSRETSWRVAPLKTMGTWFASDEEKTTGMNALLFASASYSSCVITAPSHLTPLPVPVGSLPRKRLWYVAVHTTRT